MPNQKTVIFLYLHGLHQLYHSVTTALELSNLNKNIRVLLLSCNREHTQQLERAKRGYPHVSNVEIIELNQPFRYKYLNFKKKSYPSVNAMVKRAKKYMKDADVVVTTSHGLVKMFKKFKISGPKVIIMKHGCGDRAYSFDEAYSDFDLVLLGGEHHRKVMLEKNISTESQLKVIGYPKFDFPVNLESIKSKIFKTNKPIVLYNPHWKPQFSSYNLYAKFILEYFKNNNDYNLIFAPHILIKHWKTHYKYNIDFDNYKSASIHIDFGSHYSTDNSYTRLADIYIGDVSSLVYEFIALKPRPCIFLNAHNIKWKNNLYYRFWELGFVVEKQSDFDTIFKSSINNNTFEELQKTRIKEYMDLSEVSSSKRAAQAISDFIYNK